jgi:hypothetical protein
MAITLYDEPQLIAPAGNPLVFTFSSDQTAQPNFSYVVELYIDSTLRLTQEVFRQFNTMGRIDVSEAVQSELINMPPTTNIDFDATDAMVTYGIIVFEKYGTTPVTQASVTSTTLKAFNGALEYKNWINWDYKIYDPNMTQDAIFLTDFPKTKKALCGMYENFYLGYFEQSGVAICDLNIFLLDISGNTIATDYITLTSTDFNILNVGPQVIISNSIITQNDFDDCYRYAVSVSVQGVSFVGPLVIYMDLDCKRYDTYRLHWLNKYGVFDSFTFSLVSIEESSIQSYGYQRDPGVWDNTSYEYTTNVGQMINFAKTKTEKLTLNSDWINQDVQHWLINSLYDSPVVYLEVPYGSGFEPVKVTNTSYQKKNRRRDGLIQETVTIDRTFTYRSQLN